MCTNVSTLRSIPPSLYRRPPTEGVVTDVSTPDPIPHMRKKSARLSAQVATLLPLPCCRGKHRDRPYLEQLGQTGCGLATRYLSSWHLVYISRQRHCTTPRWTTAATMDPPTQQRAMPPPRGHPLATSAKRDRYHKTLSHEDSYGPPQHARYRLPSTTQMCLTNGHAERDIPCSPSTHV